jgi:hypothetical protein
MNIDIISIATLIGFVGDATLQLLVNNNVGNWGLKDYFNLHGSVEAMFTAAGMMSVFFVIYTFIGLPLNIPALALYGIILDLIFRKIRLFPSLDGYYKSLNYLWSAVWGIIPMILPLILLRLIKTD